MKSASLYTAEPVRRRTSIEDDVTLPPGGRHGYQVGTASPEPPRRALGSKRLRFLIEPTSSQRTAVRLEGPARMCICVSRPGVFDALPPFYWVMRWNGLEQAWTQCPTGRPVRIELHGDRCFDMTVGPSEGHFDPYYVEVTILHW